MAAIIEYARFAGWLVGLLSLGLVPVGVSRWARVACRRRHWTAVGISAGAVAAPFSMGLDATFFIPLVGFVPGMIGLILATVHGSPGFRLAVALRLLPHGVLVQGIQNVYVELLTA